MIALTIKPGRTYRMRNGQKSQPVEPNDSASGTRYLWRAGLHTYQADGRLMLCEETPHDLVEPWTPGAAEKLICDVTLDDYRRGIANLRR